MKHDIFKANNGKNYRIRVSVTIRENTVWARKNDMIEKEISER